ncbi:hypothetical protein Sru01_43030 [Sphaerisporangium rufum]|uniref:Peptidase S1 domain-containing protein n=2 Tax=Sphaerisporangium rufum TaxID=1381558 RepID=A0A919R6I7_9ACTN|nr:hypothetical protein Sru01_43030 [Sphaerisporangium rufum]
MGRPALKNPALPPTVGKVFFRIGQAEYWCSATALRSKNHGNLVATAGHCAYDVGGHAAVQYWVFIPGYRDDGSTPFGIYVGHTLYMHDGFVGSGRYDYDYDYAFVTVYRGYRWDTDKNTDGTVKRNAQGQPVYKRVDVGRLEDTVGAQGFAWNRGVKVAAYAFGYPAGTHPNGSRPYDGRTLLWCLSRATTKISTPKYGLAQGVLIKSCAFTAGASGGPWLTKYRSSTRIGYLTGVNSLTWDLDGDGRYDGISSPYFNTATYRVYAFATQQKTD